MQCSSTITNSTMFKYNLSPIVQYSSTINNQQYRVSQNQITDRNRMGQQDPFQIISHRSGCWWQRQVEVGKVFLLHNVNPSPPAELSKHSTRYFFCLLSGFFGTPCTMFKYNSALSVIVQHSNTIPQKHYIR